MKYLFFWMPVLLICEIGMFAYITRIKTRMTRSCAKCFLSDLRAGLAVGGADLTADLDLKLTFETVNHTPSQRFSGS